MESITSSPRTYDVVIVGGGVIGCALAKEVSAKYRGRVCVLEKESAVACHASSRNSGVVHSGFNLKPRTLKAKLCVNGSRMLRKYCASARVPLKQIGTLVVAQDESERRVLRELQRRARMNGVPAVRILDSLELRRLEPHVSGEEGLYSPTGAIVDSRGLVESLWKDCVARGVRFLFGWKLEKVRQREYVVLKSSRGHIIRTRFLINCAGLFADRFAHKLGVGLQYRIVPFRGDYFRLRRDRTYLVNSMIYPTPDLEFPFLGIHLTRTTDDNVIIGPSASLALGREAYAGSVPNPKELIETVVSPNFARLMVDPRFLHLAVREAQSSLGGGSFARAAQRLVPEIKQSDIAPGTSGIRAQLVDSLGRLVDDFVHVETDLSFHVLNAVSPGLTCSLAFAQTVVEKLLADGYFAW